MKPPWPRTSTRALAIGLLAAGLACSATTAPNPSPGRSVLFIGNSLTYTNDLPGMVEQVARAAGDSVRVGMVAGANMAVIDHVNGGSAALATIGEGDWGFVVLQQGPTPAGTCRDTLVLAAMRVAPRIRQDGGRPVLFLPWARRGFPQTLAPAAESATQAARAVGGVVAPVGFAWDQALDANPVAPLYASDGYHPAPAGTLLAALTIYQRLRGGDVRTIPPESLARIPAGGISADLARTLAAAAHAADADLPPDPDTPVPADTTRVSPGGGPC